MFVEPQKKCSNRGRASAPGVICIPLAFAALLFAGLTLGFLASVALAGKLAVLVGEASFAGWVEIFRGFAAGNYPYRTWAHVVVLMLLTAVLVLIGYMRNRSALEFAGSPLKGTSSWADWSEVKRKFAFSFQPGLLLGSYRHLPLVLPAKADQNRNVAVFGPPDTGKSRAYVRPNLFHAVRSGWSVICTDPKGELTRDFRVWLEKQGYEVRVFNLVDFTHSDRWNPIEEIKSDTDAQLLCEVIIQSTAVPGRKGGDPFWDRAEMNLLKALVLYVALQYPPGKRNMGEVYDLLASASQQSIKNLFMPLPASHPAKLPFMIYSEMTDTVKSGAISGLGTRLQVFQNQVVRDLTGADDIPLELPGKTKCAYFCVLSDTDSTFYFLSALFFSFLFIKLTRLADRESGPLKTPVNFILDEFCNIGHIPDFTKKLSTMRSRGIGCSIIFQSIPQLKEFYQGTAWETILANCATWLVMGVKDLTTADYISRYVGKGTVEQKSHTRDLGTLFDFGKETTSYADRAVLSPDEAMRLGKNEAVVLVSGVKPVKINKRDYSKDKYYRQLEPSPVSEYRPLWRREKSFQITEQKNVRFRVSDPKPGEYVYRVGPEEEARPEAVQLDTQKQKSEEFWS